MDGITIKDLKKVLSTHSEIQTLLDLAEELTPTEQNGAYNLIGLYVQKCKAQTA